eukprot:12233463-Alexandrium_andersonii.AAC.1
MADDEGGRPGCCALLVKGVGHPLGCMRVRCKSVRPLLPGAFAGSCARWRPSHNLLGDRRIQAGSGERAGRDRSL